ncbi:MAG: hypothetical protein A3J27_05100 [Candidatus Tectomicrobia bacterium RIFCSPLOWO2_12_FULL_69_37]|nr:MAG: hypothetical protein A3I72_09425 [Candidatus Tectomicrobia bacterium RIFCSPLOWO2_02_FULL_70_19]OGL63863.1 MAG: hypothetical protein A3J27_05100 [Candidatus Tectomicrobia bacterium RIFCSPLOWO2_12_FULL_69_37]
MKKQLALISIFLLALGLASAAGAYRGSLTVVLPDDAPTMDPNVSSSGIGLTIWRWSYDTLVSTDARTGKNVPWLAEKWQKLGPAQYKFWLRKGVKFSDGTPLTTAAIQYTLDRIRDPELKSVQRGFFTDLDRLEFLDDHTFIWHLKQPDNGLLHRLARYFHVISPKVKEGPKTAPARQTFGTGPYILKSWTKGLKMVFEASPSWWGNGLHPDRPKTVSMRPIRESTTRVKALLTGEVDVIRGLGAHQIPEIRRNPGTEVGEVPSVRFFYLSFTNGFGGPFADQKVRQAVLYAIDIESIRKTILGGLGEPIGQVYHPWSYTGFSPAKKPHPHDLAKAKALMKESSYPNGFKATLVGLHGTYPFDKAAAEAMAGMLKRIGIDAAVNAVPFPMYRKLVTAYHTGVQKDPALIFRSWGTHADSPIIWRATTSCKGIWSVTCFKDLDEMNEKAGAIIGPREQQAAFEKLTDTMQERAALGILFRLVDTWGYKKNLRFVPRGDENIFPWEIGVK